MSKTKILVGLPQLGGFVYSTDPELNLEEDQAPQEDLPPAQQVLRIWLERGKGGKEATVIKGFEGSHDKIAELAKLLKNKCAAGGNAKDGVIIVQGNHRDKVLNLLLEMGYRNTKKAGS